MGSTSEQKGWLGVAVDGVKFHRKWVVLDNGVLWIHSDNKPVDASLAEEVIPLHDVEICRPEEAEKRRATLAVKTGVAGQRRMLYLRAASDAEYRRWMASMLEAARVWNARREVAAQYVPDVWGASRGHAPLELAARGGLDDCRGRVVNCLNRFAAKCSGLRAKTRKAVMHTGENVLPRFHRRAVNDAVEKVWRAGDRARAILNGVEDKQRSGAESTPAVYGAVLVLRDEVNVFVTYCSLLQDLHTMLCHGSPSGEGDEPLALSPIRGLTSLRAVLRRLTPLLRVRGLQSEEAPHRAALAAVDATLQRCWMELREQQTSASVPASQQGGRELAVFQASKDPTGDVMRLLQERQLQALPPAPSEGPARDRSSARRLASKLKRDVSVSASLRRASKRARPDRPQQLIPRDLAENIDMTHLARLGPAARRSADQERETSFGSPSVTANPAAQRSKEGGGEAQTPKRTAENKYSTLSKIKCKHSNVQSDGSVNHPVRIRRETYSPGNLYDFDDDLADDVFNETNKGVVSSEEHIYEELRLDEVSAGLLVTPVTPATPNGGGCRALWCETAEVRQSGLLDRLDPVTRALQEAKFEVLSSEESYSRSLNMLAAKIQSMEELQDTSLVADYDRDALTGFVDAALACSLRFAGALRALWSRDLLLRGLNSLMQREALSSLLQYPVIVGMQPRAASVLTKIGLRNPAAVLLIPLLSLPAQRASRLPLLLAAILRRLDQRTSEAVVCRANLDRLNQIVFECNESLRRAQHTERVSQMNKSLSVEQISRKKSSWRERKNSVFGRAKSLFQKSSSLTGRSKARTSTSSLAPLTLAADI